MLKDVAERQHAGLGHSGTFPTVADLVERWHEATSFLLKFKNFGRKSLKELNFAIEDLLRRRLVKLVAAELLPDKFTIESVTEDASPQLIASLGEVYSSLSDNLIDPGDPQFVLEPGIDIREQITNIINRLPKKENDVVLRRFGLHGHATKTLEEIGNEFYVTRERVRQVEAQAIRRLRVGTRVAAFKYLLGRESDTLWDRLSNGSELLLQQDIEERQGDIDPILQLTIAVVDDDLDNWVSKSGTPFGAGWVRTDRPIETIRLIVQDVESYLKELALPRSIAGIAEDLDIAPEDVALAARASGRFRAFEGYIVDGIVGPQARRTVRFHKVYLEQQDENLWDFTVARAAYQMRYPEDEAGSRMFELQMRRAPHLFAFIFDRIWLPMPDHGVAFRRMGTIRYNSSPASLDKEFDDDTVKNWRVRRLLELGPARGVDLTDQASAEFGSDIIPSSVQAILVMEPRFIRLAPGVFGLQEHAAALLKEGEVFSEAFFSPPHCKYYTMARKAGEPMSLYPAWDFGFEAQPCRCSKLHHPDYLYRSLLSIANPESWQVSDEERTAWAHTKSIYGEYGFEAFNPSIREATPPDESHTLAALAVLGTLGGLSWISVNRTAHRRLDSSHAVSGLALLLVLNAVRPAQHWQERHLPGADHSSVFARMANERSRKGVLSWTKGNLRLLLEEALTRLPDRNLGWLNQNEGRALIEGLLRPPEDASSTFEPVEPDDVLGSEWIAQFNE